MRRQHVLAMLATVALTAACGGGGDPVAGDTATAAADTASSSDEASPTPTPTVSSTELQLDLPRTIVLGGLATTVRGVSISNATPGTVLDAEPDPGEQSWAYLDTVTGWEDDYPGGSTQVEVGWYVLALADGSEVPAERVDFAGAHPVRDGEPVEVLRAFPVDGPGDLDGAALRIAPTGLVPATLPLDGSTPDDAWPVALDVAGEQQASIEGGCGDGLATTLLVGGEVDLDAGTDHTGDRIVLNGLARATTDHVFVRLALRTVAQSGSCGGAIVDDEQYRLVVDGLPTTPLNTHVEKLDPGSGTELTFGWLVPEDAELELLVGTAEGETATFAVPLPDLP